MDAVVAFAPLAGALIAGLLARYIGKAGAMAAATALMGVALAAAVSLFLGLYAGDAQAHTTIIARWIEIGGFKANWAIRVDMLSAIMMVVVTSVSFLVHVYSWGYMAEDANKSRFFAYLSFFTFAMLMLVTADDFLQMFFGWEGVGLASYLLIGFWFDRKSANSAAIKAFVVNRVGDVGFALGIVGVFALFGSIQFDAVFSQIEAVKEARLVAGPLDLPYLETIAVLLFIGAMGKSAQFFLHVWLPDAMEGPTPVSALIHAATMVTAGVFLVSRCAAIYDVAHGAATLILLVGAVTAFFAASVGLVQNDIKRVIAYSTCSQLGYMFVAAGAGAYQAAMFHLFTHAFFKALLFLGAGSVIHGMHHEQDMRRMGGLARALPVTYAMMLIGTLAITGVGIPGTHIGFAGFLSKDAILESAYARGLDLEIAQLAFWMGLLTALFTAFYSWRLIFMTFHGPKYWREAVAHGHDAPAHAAHDGAHPQATTHDDDHGDAHVPHESPIVMLAPLVLLAIGAVGAGMAFYEPFFGKEAESFWHGIFAGHGEHSVLEAAHHAPLWVKSAPFAAGVIGLVLAIVTYGFNPRGMRAMGEKGGPMQAFLAHKWYFDELYQAVFVRNAERLGDWFSKRIDRGTIDRFGPDGWALASRLTGGWVSRLQSGFVYHYAFVMLIGVVGLGVFALMSVGR